MNKADIVAHNAATKAVTDSRSAAAIASKDGPIASSDSLSFSDDVESESSDEDWEEYATEADEIAA